jgi:hypothetical protein
LTSTNLLICLFKHRYKAGEAENLNYILCRSRYAKNCGTDLLHPKHGEMPAELAVERIHLEEKFGNVLTSPMAQHGKK